MAKAGESWRTKEQVLIDLANALHFSADALEQNRKGYLAIEQWQRLFAKFLRPVLITAAFIVGPFGIWALIGFMNGAGLSESLDHVFSVAVQPKLLFQEHGTFVSGFILAVTLGGFVMGLRKGSKISMGLYFDLIERKVIAKEGRIEGREEQVFRTGGRDPIESYFFDLKTERFEVPSAAVQALDNGAAYCVYILPRSRVLVSIEPKVVDGVAIAS
jgi:hypothetical protein